MWHEANMRRVQEQREVDAMHTPRAEEQSET
jgi:hypothetical protein